MIRTDMQQHVLLPSIKGRLHTRKSMSRQVTIRASEGHRAFGKLLKQVYRSEDHLVVERDGFPVAVLLSYQEYQKLKKDRALAAFDRFSQELGRDIERQGLTEEKLLSELEQDKKELYQEKYGKRSG